MWRQFFLLSRAASLFRTYQTRTQWHSIAAKNQLRYYADDKGTAEHKAYELLYRAETAASWVPAPLYPAGGAAGPLLLYLIIRALSELPIRRVLELGAGQSTAVLHAWAAATGGDSTTFEHDAQWADRVSRRSRGHPTSRVIHLPLTPIRVPQGESQWYTLPDPSPVTDKSIDLLIVDGPGGTTRFSRFGIISMLPGWLNDQWVILWDDLHRPADLESFASLVTKFRQSGVPFDHVVFEGDRNVGVIHSPRFEAIRYMW